MIELGYLKEIAEYTEGKIAKIVLNETFEITAFEYKGIQDQSVLLKYMVPNGSVANVDKIELKTNSNQVISSNEVSIPITTDTVLLQTIELKEV